MDISVSTWLIWSSTWIISFMYGYFELHDFKFCLVSGINLAGHLTVILLTCKNRYNYHRKLIPNQ